MNITGGKYNSRKIKTPAYENIKPTLSKTRQGIFNTLSNMIDFEGKIFLDMFSGSGIMSLEAVSRGFSAVLFEKDRKTAAAIRESFKSLGLVPELYVCDVLKKLPTLQIKADVIFIDPPYNAGLYGTAVSVAESALNKDGIIITEHPESISLMPFNNLEIVKEKIYSDKVITYAKLIQRNN